MKNQTNILHELPCQETKNSKITKKYAQENYKKILGEKFLQQTQNKLTKKVLYELSYQVLINNFHSVEKMMKCGYFYNFDTQTFQNVLSKDNLLINNIQNIQQEKEESFEEDDLQAYINNELELKQLINN